MKSTSILIAAFFSGAAVAQPTFLVSNGSTLYRTTLGGTVETFGLSDDIVGMAVASDGTIYATSSTASTTSGLFELYTLNDAGGTPTLSLVTDQLADVYTALTFINGDLYSSLGGGGFLVNIDLNTFAETSVGHTGIFNIGGAAYDSDSDTLWWSSGIDDALYTVDYNTAASTLIGSLGIDVAQQGMDFYEFEGVLYHAVDNETSGRFELGTTSTTTGAYSYLQTIVNANLEGSTALAIIPSPATAGLLGLGGLLATRRRR
ncbi:MAG: hypothetical protein ACI89L_001263 [Phycisphaerales bacterium]|jgi:hypothetical protein